MITVINKISWKSARVARVHIQNRASAPALKTLGISYKEEQEQAPSLRSSNKTPNLAKTDCFGVFPPPRPTAQNDFESFCRSRARRELPGSFVQEQMIWIERNYAALDVEFNIERKPAVSETETHAMAAGAGG
jgi:hypothetical protein